MSENVRCFPAAIIAVNGSAKGPWAPAPASHFLYDVEVTTDEGTKVFRGCAVSEERYPDSIDCTPIRIGALVTVFVIGSRAVVGGRELPYFKDCNAP